jgi:DNA-binding transcriptional MerR regulator
MAVIPKVLTLAEVAALCGRLEGRRCSTRQVRYLLVAGGLGSEARRRAHGQTRVYHAIDVAFVRLALRLQREGVSPMVARVTLTYLRNDLIRAWKASAAVALAITGVHGSLQPVLKARPAGAAAYVPLLEIWRGLETEVHKVAAARGEVWMWRRVAVNAVPRATA